MGWLLDEPSVVLVCVTVAALLFIVEVALPTVGVAGTLAVVSGGIAIAALVEQNATWWPLLGPALAVTVWAVMLATQRRSPVGEVVAAVAFAAGGAVFAVVNDDAASMIVTALGTPALALGFPRLHGAATKLVQLPAQVGMDALIGRVASVDRWDRHGGVVLLEGSRWNATTAQAIDLTPGDHVTVIGYHGSTIDVWPPPLAYPDRPRT